MTMLNCSELFAQAKVKNCIAMVRAALAHALPETSFGERERLALAISSEAVRELLQGDLQALADGMAGEVLVDGVAYKRHEPGADTYHGLCGGLFVERWSYRQIGVRNGPTVIPLELMAGLAEGATPAMAFNVLHGYAQHDMRVHEESLRAAHRTPPSRTTLERIAKALGATAVQRSARIEPLLRRGEKVPPAAVAIAVGLDRTSVPMLEDRPADAPPKREAKRRKPRVRRAPPPCDVNWRMAYVGTVSFVDANGEALSTVRYAAPACDDPREIVERITADLRAALKRRAALRVGIVQDGAHEMWNRMREGLVQLRDEGVLDTWHEGIDRYHLLERLAEALEVIEPDGAERARLLDGWREQFDAKDSTIDAIERFLHRGYVAADDEHRAVLWDHIRFVDNNKDRMRYVSLRVAGLPVGSGVTESTCKTVIGQRAKRSGQRWREAGLRGVLTLRANHQSQRLPRFWNHLSRCYAAHVEAA